jgi:hypothetical protein
MVNNDMLDELAQEIQHNKVWITFQFLSIYYLRNIVVAL